MGLYKCKNGNYVKLIGDWYMKLDPNTKEEDRVNFIETFNEREKLAGLNYLLPRSFGLKRGGLKDGAK